MNKKYIFTSEAEAETMILALAQQDENGDLPNFRKVQVTDTTKGIVVLGFQHEYGIDEETGDMVMTKESYTYDVDVVWKTVNEDWSQYEISPSNPTHNFYI